MSFAEILPNYIEDEQEIIPHKTEWISFSDKFLLKLVNEYSSELNQFCKQNDFEYIIRLDTQVRKKTTLFKSHLTYFFSIVKPPSIKGTSLKGSQEDIQIFKVLVEQISSKIKSKLTSKRMACNIDEFNYIEKQILKDPSFTCDISYFNQEGISASLKSEDKKNPVMIGNYLINQLFVINIVRIDYPKELEFSNMDVLLLNMDQQIFVDQFGFELAESHPTMYDVINECYQSGDQLEGKEFTYNNKSTILHIQTVDNEQQCIKNLLNLLNKYDKLGQAFLKIGLTVHPKCTKSYLNELVLFFSRIDPDQDETLLRFPSEINLIVTEETESLVSNYFKEFYQTEPLKEKMIVEEQKIVYCNIFAENQIPNQQAANQMRSSMYQSPYNQSMTQSQSNFTPSRTQRRGNQSMFNSPQQAQNNQNLEFKSLSECSQKIFEEMALVGSPKVYLHILNDQEKLENAMEYTLDLDSFCIICPTLNEITPFSQVYGTEDEAIYSYYNQIGEEEVFEKQLELTLLNCQRISQRSFNFYRSIIDGRLISVEIECDLNMMEFDCDKKIGKLKKEITKVEVDKPLPDHIFHLQLLSVAAKAEEENENNDGQEDFSGRAYLKIRFLEDQIEKLDKIIEEMFYKWRIKYVLKCDSVISTHTLKYLKEIGNSNNLNFDLGENRQNLIIQGFLKTINRLRPMIIQGANIKFEDKVSFPKEWELQQPEQNLAVLDCLLNTDESTRIINLVKKTLPWTTVSRIQRIQNISLWKNFEFERKKLEAKGDATIKELFHGTRSNQPSAIYSGTEDGFDFRVSAQGMYGRGAYFHEQALYSKDYAFREGDKLQMFVAHVLTGKDFVTAPNNSLMLPPFIPGSTTVRYDSVRSNHSIGDNMYIIHNNSKAYPSYLITFSQ